MNLHILLLLSSMLENGIITYFKVTKNGFYVAIKK